MGNVSRLADARARLSDGIANLWSRLGTNADRNSRNHYFVPILTQQQAEAAYRSSWITRKVHDLVPFEMTRAGRSWQASKEQITALESLETSLQIWLKIEEALRTARLHGGAALVLGVRQGMPNTPLVVESLGKNTLRYAVVVSRHQLNAPHGFETDPESDFFRQPTMWQMRGPRGQAVDIHPSRIIPFHGSPLPAGSLATSQLDQFWGDPLLMSIKSAIDNAEVSQAAVATLLHEMKQDVISIPGLTEQIATVGAEELLAKRIEAISRFKSMFSALLLDAGDEDGKGGEAWETREINFSQHPNLLRAFLGIVAGAADIPVTRLMGESPGGLQSTGKGEQDDFNRMIKAQRTAKLAPQLARLDEILIRSALGSRPDEVTYTFGDLEDKDPKEASDIEKQEAETVQILNGTALIPSDALAKAIVNRMVESGRWPGLEKAIEESPHEIGEEPQQIDPATGQPIDPATAGLPKPANENDVQRLEQRGTITGDQAITLLADASPRSLYVRRELLNAAEFIAWAKGEGFDTTLPAGQLHVTVIFSRTSVDWMKAGEASTWGEKDGKLTVEPGGPRIVQKMGENAIALLFASQNLSWRNEDIRRMTDAQVDWPDYQPHVTITYAAPAGLDLAAVKPFAGKLEFGPEIFEEAQPNWAATVTES